MLFSCKAKYNPPRFQAPADEEFDWGSYKRPRSPQPQIGWLTKCRHKNILLLRRGSHYTVHVSLTVHKCAHIIELITVNNVVYYISLQNTLFLCLHWSNYTFQSFITSYILLVKIFCNYYLQKRCYEQLIYIYNVPTFQISHFSS